MTGIPSKILLTKVNGGRPPRKSESWKSGDRSPDPEKKVTDQAPGHPPGPPPLHFACNIYIKKAIESKKMK